MTSKKVFYGMVGLIGLLGVLVIASVLFGDLVLHKQSNKLVNLKLENQVIEAQEIALNKAKADLLKYSDLESIAKQIVPQDKDQARATREIVSLAEQSGVRIESFGFPTSNLGQAAPKASTSAATTSTLAPATTNLTQVKPVTGISNLYQLDIKINSDQAYPTDYENLIGFLEKLEQNRRTAHVTEISIDPSATSKNNYDFSLTVTVYIKS